MIDGYATLFAEAAEQAEFDLLVVPVGVGSLAAAAARFAAPRGIQLVGVEPETAACLTASLAAGSPASVPTPGTSMAGLDCSEVSSTAWPSLQAGMTGTITVSDADVHAEMRSLAAAATGARRLRRSNRHRTPPPRRGSGSERGGRLRPVDSSAARRDRRPDGPRRLRRGHSRQPLTSGQASIQSTLLAAPAVEQDPPGLPWLASTQTNP